MLHTGLGVLCLVVLDELVVPRIEVGKVEDRVRTRKAVIMHRDRYTAMSVFDKMSRHQDHHLPLNSSVSKKFRSSRGYKAKYGLSLLGSTVSHLEASFMPLVLKMSGMCTFSYHVV